MPVRDTSKLAYTKEAASGNLSASKALIINSLNPGYAYSLREICALTGMDINSVSGRVCDLKKATRLVEAKDTKKCPISKATVHPVMLPPAEDEVYEADETIQ